MDQALLPAIGPRPWPGPALPPGAEPTFAGLCAAVFGSLPRSDQRRRAEQYVSGLMSLAGRKSMRRIASLSGEGADEQSLQHFISKSTWDWVPVRRAVARHLARERPAEAWVVAPLSIPKAGSHTVGVDRRFVSELGRTANVQQAYGLWFTTGGGGVPANWRLVLPEAWIDDPGRRLRGDIPASAAAEPPVLAAASVAAEVLGWSMERRPVVADARMLGFRRLADALADADLPVLARISENSQLTVTSRTLPGYGHGPLTARQILEAARGTCRPVEWTDPDTGTARASLAVTVAVSQCRAADGPRTAKHAAPGGAHDVLTLLGEWRHPDGALAEAWLTNLGPSGPGRLLRTAKLLGVVTRDLTSAGDRMGLRDFTGRTYQGWHRHMTLASVALTASRLDGLG